MSYTVCRTFTLPVADSGSIPTCHMAPPSTLSAEPKLSPEYCQLWLQNQNRTRKNCYFHQSTISWDQHAQEAAYDLTCDGESRMLWTWGSRKEALGSGLADPSKEVVRVPTPETCRRERSSSLGSPSTPATWPQNLSEENLYSWSPRLYGANSSGSSYQKKTNKQNLTAIKVLLCSSLRFLLCDKSFPAQHFWCWTVC